MALNGDGGAREANGPPSVSKKAGHMAEQFIVVWTIDGKSVSESHSTQDEALQQAKELLRQNGCDLEIALHLNRISPPPFIWFNKRRMRGWCLAGFPAVRI
jgi:hypothetical protein